MNRVLCVVIIALLVACGALSLGLNHYRDNAITYKEQRDKKVSELEQANATITDAIATILFPSTKPTAAPAIAPATI